jgi:alpha-N-arabinofuranosidase
MVLKMYREHFGTIPVEVSGETRPFDVAATLSENRDTLVVSIINQTWEEQKFKLNLKNIETKNEVDIYTITGPDDMAYNEPGREESVKIDGPLNWNKTGSYSVKPYSATLMVFAVARNP